MSRLLVFDLEISGHHADYLLFLIKYASLSDYDEIVIAADERFKPYLNQFCEAHPEIDIVSKISFHFVSSQSIDKARAKSQLKRSIWEWHTYLDLLKTYKADRGLLMYFDLFQLGMIVGRKNNVNTAGIFFRPVLGSHYEVGLKESIANKLKNQRLKLALWRSGIKSIYVLDQYAIEELNNTKDKLTLTHLADPVEKYPRLSLEKQSELKTELGIDKNRQVLLIFGFIDGRKGVIQSLEALKLLSGEEQRKICLLIAGPVLDSFRVELEEAISKSSADVQIITSFKEYKFDQIQYLFDLSDLVLVLYQKHIGMSSVVVRAAISAKPVLATDYGMIARYIKEQQLGELVDTENYQNIAEKIRSFIQNGIAVNAQNQVAIGEFNSPKSFAATLLSKD